MSAVSEQVVREYFELHGFLVRQLRKWVGPRDRVRLESSADFVVFHPAVKNAPKDLPFELDGRCVVRIPRAAVLVLGWHSRRIYAQDVRPGSEIAAFVDRANSLADAFPGGGPAPLRILVAPGLPAGAARERAVTALRDRGVEGVLLFPRLLQELVRGVEVNRNYVRSDFLQTLRLLKTYDLLRDPQLEFFQPKRGKKRR